MSPLPIAERLEILRKRARSLYLNPCGHDVRNHALSYWIALYGLEDAERELVKEQNQRGE